jgi:hypothetical protein
MYGAPGGAPVAYGAEAQKIKGQMVADQQHVLRLKAAAVREKDVIKINCLNDKLVQINPLMNIIDSLIERLEGEAERDVVYNELVDAGNKVREQRELADQCADSNRLVSESSNAFTGPHGPEDPSEGIPGDYGGYVEPPGYASPDR